ncbi:MAG: hypothetical protein Q9173_002340, partial [Seirophora scorigena]
DRLCAPVGGFGPSLSSSVSAILASTQLSISTTPSIPSTVTASEAVSSILATATLAPDLGNPAVLSSYPRCAANPSFKQICFTETTVNGLGFASLYGSSLSGDTNNLNVNCGPDVRAATAGCEVATCTPAEYQGIELRAQQLCGSLYNRNATLSSSVSAAIASATAEARAATEGKDPTDLSVYPPCAQRCIPQNNFNGCGSITNRQCICQSIQFQDAINECETSTCSPAEIRSTQLSPMAEPLRTRCILTHAAAAILNLAEVLCAPVGGIQTNPIDYSANNFTNGSSPPVPFTGEATGLRGSFLGYMVGALAVGLGLLLL